MNPDGHTLSLGVLTYDGRVHFSAYADPDALPRAGRLAIMLEDSIEELSAATGSVNHLDRHRNGRPSALPRGEAKGAGAR